MHMCMNLVQIHAHCTTCEFVDVCMYAYNSTKFDYMNEKLRRAPGKNLNGNFFSNIGHY